MEQDGPTSKKYNGWTNSETWAVKLWLDNEEPSYRYWQEQTRRASGNREPRSILAEQLKDEIVEGSPLPDSSLYSDLLSAALAEVDWYEIAESYLEDLGDDSEPETDEQDEEEEEPCLFPEDPRAEFEYPEGNNLSLFGEVIACDSRRQALEDGVLVDVSEMAKEAGLKIPVALTHAVWAEYVTVPEGVECQDETGRLWDLLTMAKHGIVTGGPESDGELLFGLHVRNDNRAGEPPLVTLKVMCGPDDDASPCLTILEPDED